MIKQLIQVLEGAKLQTDYQNLRDMLWLSRFLPAGIPTQPSQDRQVAPPIKSRIFRTILRKRYRCRYPWETGTDFTPSETRSVLDIFIS